LTAAGPAFLWRDDGGPVVDRAAALASLGRSDPALAGVIERVGPLGLTRPNEPTTFHSLLKAIVYQQLSGAAAASIFGRVVALYHPRSRPTPDALLATPAARLRSAGLSRAKVAAVLDLAGHAAARRLPSTARLRSMEVDTAIAALTRVRGVGRWTAEMLLIFFLGHADILPVDDLGVRKGFARVYRRRSPPTPDALLRHGERWRPYRTVASWYLWRALDLPPGEPPSRSR
jgi:3-methyladenine DNA glycosylase/8-oxoguanine DNA glycosylase